MLSICIQSHRLFIREAVCNGYNFWLICSLELLWSSAYYFCIRKQILDVELDLSQLKIVQN